MCFLFSWSSPLQPNSCFKGAVKLKRGKMIVFKSMFNDVLLGEKSSSSRCLHVEDGGELPRLSACLPEELGRHPVSCQSARTRAQLTQHQERLCPGLWVAAEEILQGGRTRGPPVVSSYCTQPVIMILWRFSSNLSHDYEQVNRANIESILLMFSLGCGCQDPSSMKIGYGCWNIHQLRSLLEGQAQSEPPFRGDQKTSGEANNW